MKKQQSGFTLIEIAIVLVIIGLLLGGVLKGQEMMNNAKLKRTVNDFNGISAAIYSYLDRYGALPGDDPNAETRWGATAPAGGQTAGDGIIEGAWDSVTAGDEARLVWEHLRFAGLVSGSGNTSPTSPYGGSIGVEDFSQNTTAIASGAVVCTNNVEGKNAEILDIQLDDGVGTTGDLMNDAGDLYTAATLNTTYIICRKL